MHGERCFRKKGGAISSQRPCPPIGGGAGVRPPSLNHKIFFYNSLLVGMELNKVSKAIRYHESPRHTPPVGTLDKKIIFSGRAGDTGSATSR